MIAAQKATIGLNAGGRPAKTGTATEPVFKPGTLAEAGIDKKLSAKAQQYHAMPRDSFEAMVAAGRAEKQRTVERRTLKTIELAQARAAYDAKAERGGRISELYALARTGERFPVIYADPPWRFYNYSGQGAVDDKYATMSLEDIKALPVGALAADSAGLFLWATWPTLLEAIATIEAWGFTYKTAGFVWVKTRGNGSLHVGLGYHTRANSELVLLATRGDPHRLAMDVHQIVMAPVGEHSAKPDEVHRRIERLYAGPYLELFARRERPGWTTWGNEVPRLEAAE
jgi:N6-adenosine-specific RNA methylase IME4